MRINNGLATSGNVSVSVSGFSGVKEQVSADGKNLYRSENMSGKMFPSLSVRSKREVIRHVASCDGIFADDALGWAENGSLYYGGEEVSGLHLTPGKKQVKRIGKYLFIFPDCIYLNTSSISDYGNIFAETTVQSASVSMTDGNLTVISDYLISDTEPSDASVGTYLALYKNGGYVMEFYDGYVWKKITTYIKISADHIGSAFKTGDVLDVFGLDSVTDEKSITVSSRSDGNIYFLGIAPGVTGVSNIKLRRNVPLLDHITVSGKRIWGCRSGLDRDGKQVTAVYASAEGNPTVWSVNGGGLECPLDGSGAFTGICDYSGTVVVFRENTLTEVRMSGERLLTATFECDGLEAGAEKSPVTVGGVLYYKSRGAVCSYDGSLPKRISSPIGSFVRASASGTPAGKQNGKYYIKLSKNGIDRIYVYDTLTKTWYIEDDPGICGFAERRGVLYALYDKAPDAISPDLQGQRGIMIMDTENLPSGTENYCTPTGFPVKEDKVKWYFETGNITGEILTGKLPRRLVLRVRKEKDCIVKAGLIYGGDYGSGDDSAHSDYGRNEYSVSVTESSVPVILPVIERKCDCIRLFMTGSGECEILGYSLEYGKGSEKGLWN